MITNCPSLKSIVIPVGVKHLGFGNNLKTIETIYYEGTEEQWSNVYKSASTVPGTVTIVYNYVIE